jgi:hypothetical protein
MSLRRNFSILHLLPHVRNSGNGIVNVTVDLAVEQANYYSRVQVVGESGELGAFLRERGVGFTELSMSRSSPMSIAQSIRSLRQIVQSYIPTIVHAHTPSLVILARVALAGTGTPLVASAHNLFQRQARLLRLADQIIAVSDANGREIAHWAPPAKVAVVRNGVVGSLRGGD